MKYLLRSLHPLERKIIPFLKNNITVQELIEQAQSSDIEVMRAAQWLENKKVLTIKVDTKEIITIGDLGKKYLKEGLPEQRLLQQIKDKPSELKDIQLEKEEINIAFGELRKKTAITIGKEIAITEQGKKLLGKESLEEKFLKTLPRDISDLKEEEKLALENLKRRKDLIHVSAVKTRTITLTELGKKLVKEKLDFDLIETLTPEMVMDGTWKGKEFRNYDLQINVPKIYGGKRQPYMEFINKIKFKLVQLGFKEMTGPLIETEFYNFDVLFQPQNHPARTWTDTYQLKEPKWGSLPDELLVNKIKYAHQEGGRTGSRGWRYKWNSTTAMKLLPRSHTTALSARQLVKGIHVPCKHFAIARCYRPDVLDATHLIEFNQMEGFVADKSINFRTLLGMLKMFTTEITGIDKIKFNPSYFPFTEPSVEVFVKHPDLGWVELGGAGIFRPEITETLGIDVPVMAWGLGLDRLAMFNFRIKDIRHLFSQDLKWLREARVVV